MNYVWLFGVPRACIDFCTFRRGSENVCVVCVCVRAWKRKKINCWNRSKNGRRKRIYPYVVCLIRETIATQVVDSIHTNAPQTPSVHRRKEQKKSTRVFVYASFNWMQTHKRLIAIYTCVHLWHAIDTVSSSSPIILLLMPERKRWTRRMHIYCSQVLITNEKKKKIKKTEPFVCTTIVKTLWVTQTYSIDWSVCDWLHSIPVQSGTQGYHLKLCHALFYCAVSLLVTHSTTDMHSLNSFR